MEIEFKDLKEDIYFSRFLIINDNKIFGKEKCLKVVYSIIKKKLIYICSVTLICLPLNKVSERVTALSTLSFSANSTYAKLNK